MISADIVVTVGSDSDLSSLCCNQEARRTEVSRSGGQGMGMEACGTKPLE
jgi:hypothetical protein